MATEQQITQLLQKFATGQIDEAGYKTLIAHFKLDGNDAEIFPAMDAIWNTTTENESILTTRETERVYQNLINSPKYQSGRRSAKVTALWYRVAAAAVVLIALSAGLYWAVQRHQLATLAAALNKIGPGGNKATLTLANGKVIDLSDADIGTVAQQQNIAVSKAANGQLIYHIKTLPSVNNTAKEFNTITTPRGGQYQVDLPDGTRVWLNTSSSLRFPIHFAGNERKVTLTGEAYFEIAKNKHLPFRVITANQQVEVLGTHFNINGYEDEEAIKTTLLEGSVKITLAGNLSAGQLILKPNEEALTQNTSLNKHDADVEEAIAWKNGVFLFNNESLSEIMKQASRWYDVDVVFEDNSLKSQIFSGSISRFKNISQLIEVLESTGSVHFKIDGRRLVAMK